MKEPVAAKLPMGLDCHNGALRAVYPIKDALCLVNGATGCSYYIRAFLTAHDNRQIRILCSAMEGKHIIFGGEQLLEEALEKAVDVFHPELIVVHNTCIPSLIGDDADGICRMISRKRGIRIISAKNPNYKGGQLDGFKRVVDQYIMELMDKPKEIEKKSVNLLGVMPGEYNWDLDLKEIIRILNVLGLKVNCTLVGDDITVQEIINAPKAEANILVYPEVGISAAERMKERFGTLWVHTDLPPLGIEATQEWILKVADFFSLTSQAKAFIEEEMSKLGKAFYKLMAGQYFDLEFLFGKTFAMDAMPFRIPALVKFLAEEFSMIPTLIAFQEFDQSSFNMLHKILEENHLEPEIQISGDFRTFIDAIKRQFSEGIYPDCRPTLVFSGMTTVMELTSAGVRVPVVRFSWPVWDEVIMTDRPFLGFRGVITLTERLFNLVLQKYWYTDNTFGHIPHPFDAAREISKSAVE